MKISQSAFDLIVAEEVTSKAYYEKHYTRPEWPGGLSGITIGIGYDLGYATPSKITADWSKHVDPAMLDVMCSCAGVTASAARDLLSRVRGAIDIPWAAAIDVFASRDIPSWTAAVIKHIPKAADLTPTCLGVLVSLAYNRGVSFDNSGDRFAEMRAIKQHVQGGFLPNVADDLRGMERLWPGVRGLLNRREHEATLWTRGLNTIEPSAAGVPDMPTERDTIPRTNSPARTKPPVASKTQNGTTGAVVIGGTIAAQQAHAHGLLTTQNALFLAFLAVLGGITAWVLWYRARNPR